MTTYNEHNIRVFTDKIFDLIPIADTVRFNAEYSYIGDRKSVKISIYSKNTCVAEMFSDDIQIDFDKKFNFNQSIHKEDTQWRLALGK